MDRRAWWATILLVYFLYGHVHAFDFSFLPCVFHVAVALCYYEQERVAIQAGQIHGLIHEGEDQDRQTQKSDIADKDTYMDTEAVRSLCLVALRGDPSAQGISPFAYAP